MKNKIAHLEITDWSFSFNGEHFEGKIYWTNDDNKLSEHKLEHPLSTKEAKLINKKNEARGFSGGMYKKGDIDSRFTTEKQLICAAIDYCCDNEEIAMLVKSDYSSLGPAQVIYKADFLDKRLEEIGEEFETLYDKTNNPYLDYPEQSKSLEEEWDSLVKKHELVEY